VIACSLELSAAYFQLASNIFLSQQISQQYFQPLIFSQAIRLALQLMYKQIKKPSYCLNMYRKKTTIFANPPLH
jgi:hypothetical protein